jgi:hypothetical protein
MAGKVKDHLQSPFSERRGPFAESKDEPFDNYY